MLILTNSLFENDVTEILCESCLGHCATVESSDLPGLAQYLQETQQAVICFKCEDRRPPETRIATEAEWSMFLQTYDHLNGRLPTQAMKAWSCTTHNIDKRTILVREKAGWSFWLRGKLDRVKLTTDEASQYREQYRLMIGLLLV